MTPSRVLTILLIVMCWWLPASEYILGPQAGGVPAKLLLNVPALFSLALFAVLALAAATGTASLPQTNLEIPVVLLVASILVSVLVNLAYAPENMVGAYITCRYLPVLFLGAFVGAHGHSRLVFKTLALVGSVGAGLNFLQYLARPYELAHLLNAGGAATLQGKMGSVAGYFGQPAEMALFLVLAEVAALIMFMQSDRLKARIGWAIAALACAAATIVTYKRAETLCAAAAIAAVATYSMPPRRRVLAGLAVLAVATAALGMGLGYKFSEFDFVPGQVQKQREFSIATTWESLLTPRYWRIAIQKSRGWVLTEVGEYALYRNTPFGSSQAPRQLARRLAEKERDLGKLGRYRGLEDVYWIAFLLFYGPIGLILLVSIFAIAAIRLARAGPGLDPYQRSVRMGMLLLIALTVALTFVERSPIIRGFAFYFWLLMGAALGCVCCSFHSEQREPAPDA